MREKTPLVSVIVLTYCQQEYISQNLNAILNQECSFDYEIVLCDDASSDGTGAVCKKYQEMYPDKVVLILHEQNKGIARSYFDCFALCKGRYIADCGGDDFWIDKHKMQREVDLLEQYPFLSMVHSNWNEFHDSTGVNIDPNPDWTDSRFCPDDYGPTAVARFLNRRYVPNIVLSAACYRKNIIEEAYRQHPELFCSPEYLAEDISVTAFLLNAGPAYYLPEKHLSYRVLSESVSHSTHPEKYYRFALSSFRQTIALASFFHLTANDLAPYCDQKYPDYLHYAFISKNKSMAAVLHKSIQQIGYKPSLKQSVKYLLLRCL